ncbi:MAG: hypothetical protein ACO3FI_07760, partial [Cyclobacteriaceae bacterium]
MSHQTEHAEWLIFTAADFPAILTDSIGNISALNTRALELFGLSDSSSALALTDLPGLKNSVSPSLAGTFIKGGAGEKLQIEFDLSEKSGRLVELMVFSVSVSGNRILICNDLSELKSTREQLLLSENRFRELINNSSLGLLE